MRKSTRLKETHPNELNSWPRRKDEKFPDRESTSKPFFFQGGELVNLWGVKIHREKVGWNLWLGLIFMICALFHQWCVEKVWFPSLLWMARRCSSVGIKVDCFQRYTTFGWWILCFAASVACGFHFQTSSGEVWSPWQGALSAHGIT